MLTEYVLTKALDGALGHAKALMKESSSKLLSTSTEIQASLNYHLQSIENWSAEVSFSDLKQAKRIADIFIELDLYVQPKRLRLQPDESVGSVPFDTIFDHYPGHLVLLGQPGAGKTTSMKHLCQLLLHDDGFCAEKFSFPVLIRLRELGTTQDSAEYGYIIGEVNNILGLKLEIPEDMKDPKRGTERRRLREKLVIGVLENLKVLLILDGFDELSQYEQRDEVIKEIRNLAIHLTNATLVVTSRTGEFNYKVDNASQFELCHLNEKQVASFALKWLEDSKKSSDFLVKIYESPFADTAIRPLTLAHLCAIYERVGKIPDKPKTIYKKIINLLLEEWDQQRSVKRYSRYAHFEVDRKFEFLCHVAYVLTTSLEKTVFSKKNLIHVYNLVYEDYGLERNEADAVVNEMESHTGLLLQSGYEQFEFAHKSLQEYLTAEHLVKLPVIPSDIDISKIPSELAVAVTISSIPSEYFAELVIGRLLKNPLREDFLKAFLGRLLLEKPDFNTGPRVTLSLFALYDSYLRSRQTSGRKSGSESSESDNLRDEFTRVVRSLLRGTSGRIIQSYYELEKTYETRKGEKIHVMRKRRAVQEVTNLRGPMDQIITTDLPQRIHVRSVFIEEDGS